MTEEELDSYIAVAAKALGITIEPAWQPEVRANLAVTLRLAAAMEDFALPDEAEPAPVYRA